MNRHDAKTEPSSLDEEQAKVLDAMEPMASTTRQLGFMHSQGIATADLKATSLMTSTPCSAIELRSKPEPVRSQRDPVQALNRNI